MFVQSAIDFMLEAMAEQRREQRMGLCVHDEIRRLNPGDALFMHKTREQVLLATSSGIAATRLSKAAADIWKDQLNRIELVTVIGIVRRCIGVCTFDRATGVIKKSRAGISPAYAI